MNFRRLPLAISLSCALLALGSTAVLAQSAPGSLAELSAVQSVPQVAPLTAPSALPSQVPGPAQVPGAVPGVPSDAAHSPAPLAPAPLAPTPLASTPPAPTLGAPVLPATGQVMVGGPTPVPPQQAFPSAGPQPGGVSGAPAHDSDGVTLPPLSASAQSLIEAQDTTDESTLLRVVGRGQARLALMDLASKLETDRMKMETARLEFAKKKREAIQDAAAGATGGATGSGGVAGAGAVLPAAPVVPAFEPSVRSIFSFGSSTVAQVFVAPGASIPVQTGDVLPDGTKVVMVSDNAVTVRRHGAKKTSVLARATTADGVLSGSIPSAAIPSTGAVAPASNASLTRPAPQPAPIPQAPQP